MTAATRRIGSVVIGVALLLGSLPAGVEGRAPVDWPQFHGSAARTGWNRAEHRLTAASVGGLREAWVTLDGNEVGSPISVDGILYALIRPVVGDGPSETRALVAVEAVDGTVRWSAPIDSPLLFPGAIAAVDGLVLVSSGDRVQAFRRSTGEPAWSRQVGLASGPAIAGGVAYVATAGIAGVQEPGVVALDALTGAIRWSAPMPDPEGTIVSVAGGRVFAVGGEDLYALDAGTGAVRWHTPVGSTWSGGIAVDGDTAYIVADTGFAWLRAVDVTDGTIRWSADAQWESHTKPAIDGDTVYLSSVDGLVRAISRHRGELRWERPFAAEIWTSPLVAGRVVYVVTDWEHVEALSAKTGATLWTAEPDDPQLYLSYASPVVVDGSLYVGYGASGLHAYRLP